MKAFGTWPGKAADAVTKAPNTQTVELELADKLDRRQSTEPEIGLEYVLECRSRASYTLSSECQLCNFKVSRQYRSLKADLMCTDTLRNIKKHVVGRNLTVDTVCADIRRNMKKHVVGYDHRLAYFKKHHPEMVVGYLSFKKLKQLAAEVEVRDGRKKIRVVTDTHELKRKHGFEEDPAGPIKNQHVDHTSDKRSLDLSPPPQSQPPPPQSVPPSTSFQELKMVHAEVVKKTTLDISVDGFGTKKKFFDYLRQYQIRCEDDAAFVLKVTKSFAQSLVEYRDMVKGKAGGAASAPPVTSPPQQQVKALYPTSQNMPGQQALAAFDHNIYTDYHAKNKLGQQASVSGPPTWVYSAGPAHFIPAYSAGPPPVIPANTMVLPGGPGPHQDSNKATIEFFTNIKNLDAEEMSAILHKIAATKPAFRDMDIPNVIKTLRERGNLKPSINGNSQY